MPSSRARRKARAVVVSPSPSPSDSSIASSSSSSSSSRKQRPIVPRNGGRGLAFTTAAPPSSSLSSSQQSRLSFAKHSGPIPPARKKVKIEGEDHHSPPDVKGKGKAKERGNGILTREHTLADHTPWSQRYAPQSRADLAVHTRKVADVAAWLKDAFYGSPALRNRRRLLILTGPTGAAKTETLRQLARDPDLDFDISEWSNDTQARAGESFSHDSTTTTTSISTRLRDFLSKSARFPTLSLSTSSVGPASSSSSRSQHGSPSHRPRRLVLFEDLPTLSHQPTLDAFRDALATFLAQPDVVPVCIILPDLSAAPGAADSDDVLLAGSHDGRRETEWMRPRRLVGPDIASSDAWFEIKFNPIAATLLKKALKATLSRATTGTSHRPSVFPSDPIIQAIAEDSPGDIRAAVDTLQQVYHAFQRDPTAFGPLLSVQAAGKKRSGPPQRAMTEARLLLGRLGLVSRDSSLVLFHALGKLLYNKRVGDPDDEETNGDVDGDRISNGLTGPVPDHYQHLTRRPSRVDVKAILNSGLDLTMLSLFAHHNYPQYITDIDQCEGIMEGFSFADAEMRPRGSEQYTSTALSDQYTSLVTSHSLLVHLPSPVPRGVTPARPQPTKPDLFEAQSLQRETLSTLSHISQRRLQSTAQLALEWIPMTSKIPGGTTKEERDAVRLLTNFSPGLTAHFKGRRGGGAFANFDREEEDASRHNVVEEVAVLDGFKEDDEGRMEVDLGGESDGEEEGDDEDIEDF